MTRVIMARTQPLSNDHNGRTLTFTQILSPQGCEQRIQSYRATMNIMTSQGTVWGAPGLILSNSQCFMKIINNFMVFIKLSYKLENHFVSLHDCYFLLVSSQHLGSWVPGVINCSVRIY